MSPQRLVLEGTCYNGQPYMGEFSSYIACLDAMKQLEQEKAQETGVNPQTFRITLYS